MYEEFGAKVQDKQVAFKLFLPDNKVDPTQYIRGGHPKIREIRIKGDFQGQIGGINWEFDSAPVMTKNPHPKGWLYTYKIEVDLPEGFYQYKYFVTFENNTSRWVTDPCTKYGGSGNDENAAFVIGGPITTVQPISNRLPTKDLVIYELMVDDFTKQFRGNRAPIEAIEDKLDHLQELGVNAIEFMPWTAWPGGDFSWGYEPFLFFSVENRYLDDPSDPANKLYKLKTLINELHQRNIHVIMDGVFNHVNAGNNPNRGFPYRWLYEDPDDSPYIGKFVPTPYDVFEDFDYNNKCSEEFIRDVCLYWLNIYQIDGIRFDYTRGFFQKGNPNVGITKLISELKDYLSRGNKQNVSLLIEHLIDDRFDAIDDTNQICALGCWFDPFMFKSFDYSRNSNIDGEILRILNANLDYAPGKGPVTYIENHDHSTVIYEAGGRDRWFKTQVSAIALLTSPGIVMIHNGQEFGEDYWVPGSGPDRVIERPLHWNEYSKDFVGQRLYGIYKQLIGIRKQHPSLRSANFFPYPFNHRDGYGAFPDKDVVIYHRFGQDHNSQFEKFIIILNYSDFAQYVDIPFPSNGHWEDLLNGGVVIVDNFRLYNQRINSNWGIIYFQYG